MIQKLRTLALYLAVPIRIYLGVVFIAACLYKISQPHEFALSIATYGILPTELVNPMAIMLPWIELVCGLTLIFGLWTKASALAISGMMIMFITALLIALSKHLHMSCGCFASAEAGDDINYLTVVRDSLWLAGGMFVLWFDDGRWGMDGLLRRYFQKKASKNAISV